MQVLCHLRDPAGHVRVLLLHWHHQCDGELVAQRAGAEAEAGGKPTAFLH